MWSRRRLSHAQRKVALLRLPDWTVTGGLAGVGGERVVGGVAGAVVADLGEQAGGGHDALAVAEEGEEDRAVGVGSDGAGDLAGELADLLHDWSQRSDESDNGVATGVCARVRRRALWERL